MNCKRRLSRPGSQKHMTRTILLSLCLILTVSRPIWGFTQSAAFQQRQIANKPVSFCDGFKRLTIVREATPSPHSNLAVSLDQPLIAPLDSSRAASRVTSKLSGDFLKTSPLVKVLVSDVAKAGLVAFCLAVGLSVLARTSLLDSIQSKVVSTFKLVRGRMQRFADRFQKEEKGVPMAFNPDVGDGWERCTLRAKRTLGKTSFAQYDFDLPEPNNVLGLDLGQKLHMCCVDNENRMAKGEFFPYTASKSESSFSILVPNRSTKENQIEVGRDAANFARVLREDMKVGDEVALKAGDRRLSYRGEYLPVTDMLYVASGVGIVPVMEQVRTVLKSRSSSVKSVEVVWVNRDTKDFDVIAGELENEYYKYFNKLSVQCIVDDLRTHSLEQNSEMESAVPNFRPGIMAVLAGSPDISQKTKLYLIDRGYPEDCICVL